MDSIKPSKRIRLDQQQTPADTEKNPSFATRRVRKQAADPAITDKSQSDNDIKSAATSVMSFDLLARAADDILGPESLAADPEQRKQSVTSSQSTSIDSLIRAADDILGPESLPANPEQEEVQEEQGITSSQSASIDNLTRAADDILGPESLAANSEREEVQEKQGITSSQSASIDNLTRAADDILGPESLATNSEQEEVQEEQDITSSQSASIDHLTRAAGDILGPESLPANQEEEEVQEVQEEQGITSSQSTSINSLTRAAESVLYGGSLPPNPQRGIAFFEKMPLEERYRFLVDEKILFDEKGASLFAEREPGCLKGGAMVYQKIVSLLRDGITPMELLDKEYLKELHRILFEPIRILSIRGKTKKLQSAGSFRSRRVYIRLMNNFTKKGLCEAQDFHKKICPNSDWIKGIFQVDVYQSDSEHARKVVHKYAPDAKDVPKYVKDPKCVVDFQPVSHKYKALEELVKTHLSDARKKLENVSTVSELIRFLAEFSTQLDQMHPFENGNIRIIRALVDFILMYFGHAPIIWYDPNIIDFYDTELLTGIMKNSIEASEKQIEALAEGKRRKATYKSNDADKQLSLAAFSKDNSRESQPPTSNKT